MTFDEWLKDSGIPPIHDDHILAFIKMAWNAGQRSLMLDTFFSQESVNATFDEGKIKTEAQRQKNLIL